MIVQDIFKQIISININFFFKLFVIFQVRAVTQTCQNGGPYRGLRHRLPVPERRRPTGTSRRCFPGQVVPGEQSQPRQGNTYNFPNKKKNIS